MNKKHLGKKVFVYRNLHKNCYSVKDMKTGRVIAHVDSISLSMVEFKVSQKGRERVLREKRKHVHAGVVGTWIRSSCSRNLNIPVTYNPYKYTSFVTAQKESPVQTATKACLSSNGVRAQNVA